MILIAVCIGLAAIAALAPPSRWNPAGLSEALSALASLAMLLFGILLLATGSTVEARLGNVLSFTPVSVHYDALSALFLIALGSVGLASSLFAVGYRRSHPASGRDLTAAAYPVFLASLMLVFGANDAFAFLFAWELMALSSAALVIGSRPSPATAHAGYLYLAITHLATAALVVAFAILSAGSGSTAFATFAISAADLPPLGRDAVFVLLLLGFATKAGAIPFHSWLPAAHPVAPSHVSALMSGVMIKAGIYGIVRINIGILGPGPEWWGLLVVGLGVASAVLGVLYALMEHDLKRLLAFHSIENVGIILIGLGVAIVAASDGLGALAGFALTAALFHTLNHALFKGALFLGAGSIQAAVGSRDLNLLGGLVRLMPLTAITFGIAAAAISGLPPLNGFASEWLTFQGLLGAAGAGALSEVARSVALVAIGGLALTSSLALACFVKAAGMAFLARPRSHAAGIAREQHPAMGLAMAGLAAVCVVVGLAAGPVSIIISGVASAISEPGVGVLAPTALAPVAALPGRALYAAGPLALAVIVASGAISLAARHSRPTRRVPTWTTGVAPEAAFEYTATSYAKLIRLYFGSVLRPVREVRVELHPGTPFPRTIRYRGEVSHVLDERLYRPLHRAAVGAAHGVRRLQGGSLQLYLAYAVAAALVLLVVAR